VRIHAGMATDAEYADRSRNQKATIDDTAESVRRGRPVSCYGGLCSSRASC
jgi:hypothetical protein